MSYNHYSSSQPASNYGGGMLLPEPGSRIVQLPGGAYEHAAYAGVEFGRSGLDATINSRIVQAIASALEVELSCGGNAVYISPPVSREKALQIGRLINRHSTEALVAERKAAEVVELGACAAVA